MLEILTKEFARALAHVDRSSGQARLAVSCVRAVLVGLRNGIRINLAVVEGPASGPKHAVWLRATDDFVVCTLQFREVRVWVWFGGIGEAGTWASANEQLTMVLREDGQPTVVKFGTSMEVDPESLRGIPDAADDEPSLLDSVSPELVRRVDLPPEALEILARTNRKSLPTAIPALQALAEKLGVDLVSTLIRALVALSNGELRQAEAQLELAGGLIDRSSMSQPNSVQKDAIARSREELIPLSELSGEEVQHYLQGDHFRDWLIFLHPDQHGVVGRQFSGPARLTGVSGSGKTIILLHRARRLALDHPRERILVVTLRPSLARLLSQLLNRLCTGDERGRIEVEAVYDLCHRLLKEVGVNTEEHRLVAKKAKYGGVEDVELLTHAEGRVSSWQEFFEQPEIGKRNYKLIVFMARTFLESKNGFKEWARASEYLREWEALAKEARHKILFTDVHYRRRFGPEGAPLAQRALAEAARYLRDELHWVRSAFLKAQRREYLGVKRIGRAIPFTPEQRKWVLKLLDDWEEWMPVGQVRDPAGVSLLAGEMARRIANKSALRYRCVLVDEAQDFSTVELRVLQALTKDAENGLMLVGDAAQQVYPKHNSLSDAGLQVSGRSMVIRRNYRNTWEILHAASALSARWQPPVGDDAKGFLLLDPELSARHGPVPELYVHATDNAQCRWVVERVLKAMKRYGGAPVCVVSALGSTRKAVHAALLEKGVSAAFLDQDVLVDTGVVVGEYEDVKGYEFPVVVICDLGESVMPYAGLPEKEWWREACHLYVAMTRASEEVILNSVGTPCLFVDAMHGRIRRMAP